MVTQSDGKYKNFRDCCVKELESCMEYVQQYSKNKEKDLEDLLDIAKEYTNKDIEYNRSKQASKDTEDYFNDQENDCTEDVVQVYKRCLEKLPIESYENHRIWQMFNKNPGEGTAEMSDVEEIQEGETETILEGFIPSAFEPPVDPITKQVISDPCKNKKCGHIYEYSTVMSHLKRIKANKVKATCPYIGCQNKNMASTYIMRDKVLKQQIQIYLANKGDESEPESDENVTDIL